MINNKFSAISKQKTIDLRSFIVRQKRVVIFLLSYSLEYDNI